jgi:D-alanyl-D-alanine carboxypeptidase
MDISEIGAAVEAFALGALRATGTPGGVLAIADGTDSLVRTYGYADLAQQTPMTGAHTFHGGSLSKIYVAAVVMRLVERGVLDLDEPVSEHIALRNPLGGDITLHHLLTHTAGLATDTFDATLGVAPPTPAASLAAEAYGPEYGGARPRWDAPVGKQFRYSSLSISLAGDVVAAVVGRPYADVVAEEVTARLGRTATAWPYGAGWKAALDRRMTGYMLFGDMAVPTPEVGTGFEASTGVVTTAADHNRMMVALLGGGPLMGDDSLRRMTSPPAEQSFLGIPQGMQIGLGLQLRSTETAGRAYGHAGGFPYGWWSVGWTFPEVGLAVTAADNAWDMRQYMHVESTWAWVVANEVARLRAGGKPLSGGGRSMEYVAGAVTAARIHGLLGVGAGLSDESLAAMRDGARPVERRQGLAWDGADYIAGVRALEAARSAGEIGQCVTAADGLAQGVGLAALAWGDRGSQRLLVEPHLAS